MLYNHFGQHFYIEKILYKEKTRHQDLIIFENIDLGRIMALNGVVQTTERDEFIYHEMMTCIPIFSHGSAKKVLIIGGGDGGILREISRHLSIEQITMVEIDVGVITLCKQYLPNHSAGAFNDDRLILIIQDGASFINQCSEKFDIIISDCTDPIGPGKNLFTSNFYHGCAKCLNKDGIFVSQNGVCFFQKQEVINAYSNLSVYFKDVGFYQASIPTYHGGIMTFAWASQNPELRYIDDRTLSVRITRTGLSWRYYNANIHQSSFSLPQYLLNALLEAR